MKSRRFAAFIEKLFKAPPQKTPEEMFTPRVLQLISTAKNRSASPTGKDVAAALFNLNAGVGWQVVRRFKLDVKTLHAAADSDTASAPLDQVLAIAEDERRKLFHRYLGTEHLFLATIQCIPQLAACLKENNLELDDIRAQVMRELDPNYDPGG